MADINGTPGDDTLVGTAGNDRIDGGAGADGMYGGAGDDTYFVDHVGDFAIEAANEGRDIVYASITHALVGGSEIEILTAIDNGATTALDLHGNELNNELWGNNGVNFLSGSGGNDVLIGFGGNDLLIGGEGADTLDGGEGSDALYGSAGDDTIVGGAGNDYIDGGTGGDGMYGGAGDDIYFTDHAGDFTIEAGGQGRDIVYASTTHALVAGSEIEVLTALSNTATTALDLYGNGFANELWGTNGANWLGGGGGNDQLVAFGGNDYLDGGAGGDGMYGGAGDDIYFVDDVGDFGIEAGGEGRDSIYASLSHALVAGSEVEILSAIDNNGTTALDLHGNELANEIWGNNAVNFLSGSGGNDSLVGFGGNDLLIGGDGVDTLDGGEGNDALYGSAGNDTVIGGGGNDYIDGGADADGMYGGAGDDSYFADHAGDFAIEAADSGRDIVYASLTHALVAGSQIEVLSAVDNNGTGAFDLYGNAFANEIWGNNGANLLSGGGGNDILLGFGGADHLMGGTGVDSLTGGEGADTFVVDAALTGGNLTIVTDFTAGLDRILLGASPGQPFAALASGALAAGAFVIGSAAADANDYLIYNSGTGALLYDADGNGGAAAVQFASLSSGLSLTAADFTVAGPANNPPAITSGGTASIPENSPASTIVYQATASDADGDRITFSLSGADAALLTIDAVTGAVRLISPADYETKTSYLFNVIASDSGSSTTQGVSLAVTDVSDVSTPIINETAAPNDATASAQAIDRGIFVVANNPNLPDDDLPSATIRGNLPDSGDKDFFSITLQAGEKLILDVDNSGGNLDSHIRVYGPGGTEIGDNDDHGAPDTGSPPHPTYGHNTDSFFSFRAATSGTYFFSIESFQDATNPTFGSYDINVSIGPPATAQQLIEEDIDALVSGAEWTDTNLTFGFPTQASQYPDNFDEANPDGEFQAFSAAQQAATRQLLQLVGNVSSLTFTELTANPGEADLRYAMSTDDDVEAAHAYYPTNGGPSSPGGSAWFNTTSFADPLKGNYAWMGILHETGHALGLKHGHEAPAIRTERDSVEYTVMTYRSYVGDDADGYNNAQFGFPQTLMMYDIAALQRMYGANFAHNAGNSIYTWSPTNGEMFVNGAGQGVPGGGSGAQANRVFLTVWDGGGIDTYDLSNYTAGTVGALGATIDLRPGEWTTTSGLQLAGLGNGHTARGNVASALQFEGDTRSLIENAIGSQTADTIIANQAANQLTGNNGTDVFKWVASTDAGTGALADTILDLSRDVDLINLADIDANANTGANDAFTFLGTGAFQSVAGQLRYQVEGGNVRVQADLDGNGVADMEIVVNNTTILTASDFVF